MPPPAGIDQNVSRVQQRGEARDVGDPLLSLVGGGSVLQAMPIRSHEQNVHTVQQNTFLP